MARTGSSCLSGVGMLVCIRWVCEYCLSWKEDEESERTRAVDISYYRYVMPTAWLGVGRWMHESLIGIVSKASQQGTRHCAGSVAHHMPCRITATRPQGRVEVARCSSHLLVVELQSTTRLRPPSAA